MPSPPATTTPSSDDVKSWYNQHYAANGLESMRPAAAYPVFLDLLGATTGPGYQFVFVLERRRGAPTSP